MDHSEWDLLNFQIVKKRLQAFRDAFRGWLFFSHEPHAIIHLIAACVVVGLAYWLEVTKTDWMILLLCIGVVLVTEMLNSALERLADALHPDHHPLVGKSKDIAAGAVLVVAVIAAVIGGMIFWPYLAA